MDWMPIVEVRYLLVPIYFFKLFSHYSQLNSIVRVSCSVCVYLFPPPQWRISHLFIKRSALKIN